MKKLLTIGSATLLSAVNAASVFAQATSNEEIHINRTGNIGLNPGTPLGIIISNVLTIAIVVAALAVLFMLIFGAFEWITSGGDKESVSKARNRIVNALIGLAILAIAFVIVRVVGGLVGVNLTNVTLPRLDNGAS